MKINQGTVFQTSHFLTFRGYRYLRFLCIFWAGLYLLPSTGCFQKDNQNTGPFPLVHSQELKSPDLKSIIEFEPFKSWDLRSYRPLAVHKAKLLRNEELLIQWIDFPSEYLAFGFFMASNPFVYNSSYSFAIKNWLIIYRNRQVAIIEKLNGGSWKNSEIDNFLKELPPRPPFEFANLPLQERLPGSEKVVIRMPLPGLEKGDFIMASYPCHYTTAQVFRAILPSSALTLESIKKNLLRPTYKTDSGASPYFSIWGYDRFEDFWFVESDDNEILGVFGCPDIELSQSYIQKMMAIPIKIRWWLPES